MDDPDKTLDRSASHPTRDLPTEVRVHPRQSGCETLERKATPRDADEQETEARLTNDRSIGTIQEEPQARGKLSAFLDTDDHDSLLDSLTGKKIAGRYLIEERLDSGGFGSVYRATDELKRSYGEDPSIAIKVIDAGEIGDRMSALIQEVTMSHRVSHPNIVRVYNVDIDDGLAFISMELLKGVSLQERMTSSAQANGATGRLFPLREVDHIAESLCDALSYCHKQQLVHADVKPANIFLCSDGTVKLLDLGISQIAGSKGRVSGYSARYASPQQIADEVSDPRDDVYSLGCVLFECLTGRLPYQESSDPSGAGGGTGFSVGELPLRYRRALSRALCLDRAPRLDSPRRLWRMVDPALWRRTAISILLGAATMIALWQYGAWMESRVREAVIRIFVRETSQSKAEASFNRGLSLLEDQNFEDARSRFLEAIRFNPAHEKAAIELAALVAAVDFTQPISYSAAWKDLHRALSSAPNSAPLNEFAARRTEQILNSDSSSLSRSRILSEFRAPVCVLLEVGPKSSKGDLERLREDFSINCPKM